MNVEGVIIIALLLGLLVVGFISVSYLRRQYKHDKLMQDRYKRIEEWNNRQKKLED